MLDQLSRLRDDIFSRTDKGDDAIREVSNRFALDLKAFSEQFSMGFGFRSPVREPTRSMRNTAQFIAVGMILGLIFGWGISTVRVWPRNAVRESAAASLPTIAPLRAAE